MSLVKKNLLANFIGKGWAALMGFAFVPLYIKLMGIEAYGLVGFFSTLVAVFALLDLGLTTTLNRELARYSALPDKSSEMRDLVRTLETVYWGLAALIGIITISLAPFIAHQWLQIKNLPVGVVQQAIILMGLVLAFHWPLTFYSGGLIGLQRHVLYNSIHATWFTLRFAGVVVVLWLISPTITTFFTFQVLVSVISTFLMALALWRNLPGGKQHPRFRVDLLRSVWRFTAGMTGISATVLILTQLDKIILSRLLSLEMFAYYSLAWMVASSLTNLTNPVFVAIFPGFSQRVALGDTVGVSALYHRSCQLISVLILPVALIVVFFAPEILWLWTRDSTTVTNTQWLVSLLMIGTALNGLMNLPYALQLAYGWTKLSFYTNLVSIMLLVPLLLFATSHYGAVGAALMWVLLNSGYVLIVLQFMHRRLLIGEQRRWYIEDIGLPLIAALLIVSLGYWIFPDHLSPVATFMSLVAVLILAFVASALAAPQVRNWGINQSRKIRAGYANVS